MVTQIHGSPQSTEQITRSGECNVMPLHQGMGQITREEQCTKFICLAMIVPLIT